MATWTAVLKFSDNGREELEEVDVNASSRSEALKLVKKEIEETYEGRGTLVELIEQAPGMFYRY